MKKQKCCTKNTNIIEGEVDDCKIADKFARNFLQSQNENSTEEESEFLNSFKNRWRQGRKMYIKISLETLKKLISSLKSGVGHDGIHSKYLKNASEKILNKIVLLLNVCFSHCYLPNSLLKGIISPLVKDLKGNITEMSNYRPVMQSSCILKIFETHILNVLSEKINFSQRQFGFTAGVSTADTCFLLKEVIYENTKNKNRVTATFIDLSKAFDKVNHFILGKKLLKKNIPVDIVFILMHYLRNQFAVVKWKGAYSDWFVVDTGVRQGGVLSPFLFNFFIDDIIRNISNIPAGCLFGVVRVNVLAYADDLVIIASSRSDMEELYTKLCLLINEHKLIINKKKTKCIDFCRTIRNNTELFTKFGNDKLEIVKSHKYLGYMLESSLRDDADIGLRLNKFYASTNSVLRNFKLVNSETMSFLFKSYCMPDYGLCLWSHKDTMNKSIFKTFNVAYNNVLKRIIGVPTYSSSHEAAEACNVLLLNHHIAQLQARYLKRMLKSKHPLIRLNIPFLKQGLLLPYVFDIFKTKYNVDIYANDSDILNARVGWVQRHEERRTPFLHFIV